jgi:hypothetical protein
MRSLFVTGLLIFSSSALADYCKFDPDRGNTGELVCEIPGLPVFEAGLTYDQVRRKLIAAGFSPAPQKKHGFVEQSCKRFTIEAHTELDFCSRTCSCHYVWRINGESKLIDVEFSSKEFTPNFSDHFTSQQ